jgi:hypothetical protein
MASFTPEQGYALLTSGKNSDFVIECQGRTWNVHKVIISTVSDHFATLCQGGFKGGGLARIFNLHLHCCLVIDLH